YPTGTGEAITLPEGPLEQFQSAAWFPQGSSLLVAGNEPGRPTRLYRQAVAGGSLLALTEPGVYVGAHLAPAGDSVIVRDEKGRWESCVFDKPPCRALAMMHDSDNVL